MSIKLIFLVLTTLIATIFLLQNTPPNHIVISGKLEGKTQGIFHIAKEIIQNEDHQILRATIKTKEDMKKIKVVWHLGSGAQALGETRKELDLFSGTPSTVELPVSGEEGLVHLEVYAENSGLKMGQTILFNLASKNILDGVKAFSFKAKENSKPKVRIFQ